MGFPIIKNILNVFAATNSQIIYGTGFILPLKQKQHIKGVNVNMTISFEVKIVSTETTKNKRTNSLFWLTPALLSVLSASSLKKPSSSKNTESEVMAKNSTKIFTGFIEFTVFPSNIAHISLVSEAKAS